ncbi:hypothetical protein ACFPL7_05695 [Dongia soli]|uniref:N-acetyltransferase domain-containing protein n=1 Tax=Dongia soli TaxID=600628 RepID=A0ABU5EES8_9PROT|nr:hypothetical protein [Dongia soli]MDY0884894.1 hypothetical protein [Dongia soli]
MARKPYHVVDATPDHAVALARIMRRADRDEIHAASGLGPLVGLRASLDASVLARCWLVEDQPACIFGLATDSLLSGTGRPWMLTSDLLLREQRIFLRHCRDFVAEMLDIFPVLANWVDARYIGSIKWLHWMGFRLYPAEPLGPFGMLFHRFEMRGGDVDCQPSVATVDPRIKSEGDNSGQVDVVQHTLSMNIAPHPQQTRLSPSDLIPVGAGRPSSAGSTVETEERKVTLA